MSILVFLGRIKFCDIYGTVRMQGKRIKVIIIDKFHFSKKSGICYMKVKFKKFEEKFKLTFRKIAENFQRNFNRILKNFWNKFWV